jgi:hypothetical protein
MKRLCGMRSNANGGWRGVRMMSMESMNVFDRKAKRLQKDRAALLENSREFDYLKEEIAKRLADRLDVRLQRWRIVETSRIS